MAFPTSVNSQITDSVTQANTEVLGTAPAVAMGMTYLAMADSIGLAMQNAVACQQRSQITANTATTVATARILRAASG